MKYLNSDSPMIHFKNTISNKYYADKSLMIEEVSSNIGTGTHYICVTRPRRFGKTINARMLAAYYTKGYDSSGLFDHLLISETVNYRRWINSQNVIFIDFSEQPDLCESFKDYLTYYMKGLRRDLEEAYPFLKNRDFDRISDMFEATGDSFIFILDEWDSIFYEKFITDDDKSRFLKWLKGLLKDCSYVDLVYMTGIFVKKEDCNEENNRFTEEFRLQNRERNAGRRDQRTGL